MAAQPSMARPSAALTAPTLAPVARPSRPTAAGRSWWQRVRSGFSLVADDPGVEQDWWHPELAAAGTLKREG